MPPTLDGRVFVRQQIFASLQEDLQEDTKLFRTFVEQDKSRLFQDHRHTLVKSVYSVKGCELIDTIIHWLETCHALAWVGQTWVAPIEADPTEVPASMKSPDATAEQLELYAKQIAEALVLMGFLTPYKDDHIHLSSITLEQCVHDRTLLIPVAPDVADLSTTSVWSVADGAVYARALKRKAGVLGLFATTGRNVYVIVNDKTKKLYLFESDLARDLISELSCASLSIELDNQQFDFGVRVSSTSSDLEEDRSEYFNAETLDRQEEFVSACVSVGAICDDGGVKKSINADGVDLVGHDAVLGYQTKHLEMAEEDPVAELTATSLSGPRPASHSKISRLLIPTDEPAATKRQKHSAVPQPTLTENQKEHGGSYSTLADQLHKHAFVSLARASADPRAVTQQYDNIIPSSHAGTPATDVPTMTKHSEDSVAVHPAPHIAP
ncbi:hypothetical protein Gpo141_00012227 [Globisporangium polare]